MAIGALLAPMGLAAGPVVPTREWRELYSALDCAVVAAVHPFYTASVREFAAAGRAVVGSARSGVDGTAAWLDAIGAATGTAQHLIDAAKNKALAGISAALAGSPIKGRITVSGYEGSELLVARLLVESGADVQYVGTACPRTPWSEPDRDWLDAHGVPVKYRASLADDLAAVDAFTPNLAIGTTPSSSTPRSARFRRSTSPSDLRAPADGRGRRGQSRDGRQRRARQPGALR